MARQQAARRPVPNTGSDSNTPSAGDARSLLLRFEPELAVRAIVFHLADEGLSPKVAGDSVRATISRLRRAALCPQIEQWIWSQMTNAQRLEWLLQNTQTTARLLSDEMSVLESQST